MVTNDEPRPETISVAVGPATRRWKVVTAAALLICAGGAWFAATRSEGVLSPPDGPWPEQRRFMVFQCSMEGLTPETQPVVERFLRAVPEIERLKVYTKAQVEARPYGGHNVCGVQAHFVGTARHPDDIPKIAERMAGSPVPVNLVRLPVNFWAGKADLQVTLSYPGSSLLDFGAEWARVPTRHDKELIAEKIRQAVDVEHLYYVDTAFDTKLNAYYCPDQLCAYPRSPMESFYVRTDAPSALGKLRRALEHVPGVEGVLAVTPDAN
ncbi:hypothetical protein [Sphaerisporangium fuscum]|uniref:hypothetical protein n=1 Tax=Sphaerisporangium fuscum TaxID=2835868 RepID=UPI001BDD1D9C|nr:hypothetical protein [Sphaerisporangium fuscum]